MRLTTLGWVALTAMAASLANAEDAGFESVIGTKHDLTTQPQLGGDRGTCGYCHKVDGLSGEVLAELDRPPPASEIHLYGETILGQQTGALSASSSHCMSCHDGLTPLDAVADDAGDKAHNMFELYPESNAIIGTDLKAHHPTGVSLPVHREYAQASAIAGSVLRLFDGKVECLTCHDVHGTAGFEQLLVMDNGHGVLCLTCHTGK